MEFAIPADDRKKIRYTKKINEYLDLAMELKKTVEHKGNGDTTRR